MLAESIAKHLFVPRLLAQTQNQIKRSKRGNPLAPRSVFWHYVYSSILTQNSTILLVQDNNAKAHLLATLKRDLPQAWKMSHIRNGIFRSACKNIARNNGGLNTNLKHSLDPSLIAADLNANVIAADLNANVIAADLKGTHHRVEIVQTKVDRTSQTQSASNLNEKTRHLIASLALLPAANCFLLFTNEAVPDLAQINKILSAPSMSPLTLVGGITGNMLLTNQTFKVVLEMPGIDDQRREVVECLEQGAKSLVECVAHNQNLLVKLLDARI